MKAQFYPENPRVIRVFDQYGQMLCDIPYSGRVVSEAMLDADLAKVRIRRRGKWTNYSAGSGRMKWKEATVRWK